MPTWTSTLTTDFLSIVNHHIKKGKLHLHDSIDLLCCLKMVLCQ